MTQPFKKLQWSIWDEDTLSFDEYHVLSCILKNHYYQLSWHAADNLLLIIFPKDF